MRWWLNTDHKQFSVDNSSVQGLDFSSLDPDIWMVQWTDGRGEIERQDVAVDANLNGLRENFIDVMPYAPLFQQFLRLTPDLSIDQAKKVQIELINTIFDSKRQMPFHYVVASGDYWWDASDGSMAAATIPSVTSTITSLNNVINQLNSLASEVNIRLTDVNSLATEVQTDVVQNANLGFNVIDSITTHLTNAGNSDQVHSNSTILGAVNAKLLSGPLTITEGTFYVALPGLTAAIPLASFDWLAGGSTNPYRCGDISTFIPSISWSNIPQVSVPTSSWVPIGLDHSVPVTPQESAAILSGISARTNQLNLARNSKNMAVNALTMINDVINYDVTTGWPATPLPPGYELWQPMSAGSGSNVVFVGSGGTVSGGVPEAPSDGVTYGRKDAAWNPALAKTADILDGGNF